MTGEIHLHDAEWYAALTLQERITLWRRHGSPDLTSLVDDRMADWRLQEWRKQRPFDNDAFFQARLASSGVDETTFRNLTGVHGAVLGGWCDTAPEWLVSLRRIVARESIRLPATGGPESQRQLLEIFSPFMVDAQIRLRDAAVEMTRGHDAPLFDPTTVAGVFSASLLTQVLGTVSRVFTLELHVARLQGLLSGDTPEERFRSFVERLRRPEHLVAFLRDYPPMARMLVRLTDQWVETTAEVLQHLCDDAAVLRERFHGGEPIGQLAGVDNTGVGDSHRGGRSVAILDFSSGLRLVYKPRSLDVDDAFHGLLQWLNGTGEFLPFRTITTLSRESHGWVEFVRATPCTAQEEVGRYYERLGGLLAVLHVLDGQDMHMENIVASGEHPVLIDLETLFHPLMDELLPLPEHGEEDAGEDEGLTEPMEFIPRSVMKIGLLPQRIWTEDNGVGIDLSGLGGAGNQMVPGRTIQVENLGSDEMRVSRTQAFMKGANNQPQLAGEGVSRAAFADAVDRGFTTVYGILAARRDELTRDGLLAAFAEIPLRVVIRQTRTYGAVLRESYHPDLLRDAVDRDRFFDQLWLAVQEKAPLERITPLEQQALHREDIPMFHAVPASRDATADTGEIVPGFFRESGLERVAARITAMGDVDLARQRMLIRSSMATLADDPLAPPAAPTPTFALAAWTREEAPSRPTDAGTARLVELAHEVGERLERTALRGRRMTSWITCASENGRFSTPGLARYDLHAGVPGIILFLGRLKEVAETSRFDALARGSFGMLQEVLHDGDLTLREVGGFGGLGGVLLALGAAEECWPELPARSLAERVVARMGEVADEQTQDGLFGGLAGAVAALLSYHAATGAPRAMETAVRCGDGLLGRVGHVDGHLDWSAAHGPGFTLGTAGISWALLRLAEATGYDRFRAPALEALDHAWRRWSESERTAAHDTWCYGAPGMALALLAARDAGAEPLRPALDAAVHATLRAASAPAASHALCNGTMGVLDVLLSVEAALPSAALRAGIEAGTRALLDDSARGGWRCGVPLGMEVPGLMNGLAGIGHGLLRLARPDRVSSALTLELRPAPLAVVS